jgi:hypothetical protein
MCQNILVVAREELHRKKFQNFFISMILIIVNKNTCKGTVFQRNNKKIQKKYLRPTLIYPFYQPPTPGTTEKRREGTAKGRTKR